MVSARSYISLYAASSRSYSSPSSGSSPRTETQEQLLERLQAKGIKSTQATISRDIKELHLIKEPAGQGKYRYAVSAHRTKLNFADKLRTIFRESVLTVDNAQNIVVIKTLPGLANAAGSAVDGMDVPYLVGSLAGDDTALPVSYTHLTLPTICSV